MSKIVLSVEQKVESNATIRHLHVQSGRKQQTLFVRCEDESFPDPQVLDGFVLGILFHAMQSGADVHVRGSVSRRLLLHLQEFQEAWRILRPERYRVIQIVPDTIVDRAEGRGPGALAAFSGGIDSTFTAWRHAGRKLGNGSHSLRGLMLVQGFDVRLDNTEAFRRLIQRCSPAPESLGLRLRVVSTNLKEAKLQDWEDSHGALIACCLHQYSHEFEFGIIAGSAPYHSLILPWGSNPMTDPLLSGNAMTIVHDGAGYTRPQKLESLLKAGLPLHGLKVCWEGAKQDRNCGRCEKCIRTHLSFLAAGTVAPCFDEPLRMRDVETLVIQGIVSYRHMSAVYELAAMHGREQEPWAVALKSGLDQYQPAGAARRLFRAAKRRARRLIAGR